MHVSLSVVREEQAAARDDAQGLEERAKRGPTRPRKVAERLERGRAKKILRRECEQKQDFDRSSSQKDSLFLFCSRSLERERERTLSPSLARFTMAGPSSSNSSRRSQVPGLAGSLFDRQLTGGPGEIGEEEGERRFQNFDVDDSDADRFPIKNFKLTSQSSAAPSSTRSPRVRAPEGVSWSTTLAGTPRRPSASSTTR